MRRLLVTVDAGERECGACRLLSVDAIGNGECLAFGGEPWSSPDVAHMRLDACLAAEQQAEQGAWEGR